MVRVWLRRQWVEDLWWATEDPWLRLFGCVQVFMGTFRVRDLPRPSEWAGVCILTYVYCLTASSFMLLSPPPGNHSLTVHGNIRTASIRLPPQRPSETSTWWSGVFLGRRSKKTCALSTITALQEISLSVVYSISSDASLMVLHPNILDEYDWAHHCEREFTQCQTQTVHESAMVSVYAKSKPSPDHLACLGMRPLATTSAGEVRTF